MPSYKYSVSFVDQEPDSEAFFSGVLPSFSAGQVARQSDSEAFFSGAVSSYSAGQIGQITSNEAFFAIQNASDWVVWLDSWDAILTPWEDLK